MSVDLLGDLSMHSFAMICLSALKRRAHGRAHDVSASPNTSAERYSRRCKRRPSRRCQCTLFRGTANEEMGVRPVPRDTTNQWRRSSSQEQAKGADLNACFQVRVWKPMASADGASTTPPFGSVAWNRPGAELQSRLHMRYVLK